MILVKKIWRQLSFLLFPLILACNDGVGAYQKESITGVSQSVPRSAGASVSEIEQTRKLIKEAQVVFEAPAFEKRKETIRRVVGKYQAYFILDKMDTGPYRIQHNYTIRVPSAHFNDLIDELSLGINDFDKKEIVVNDITEAYVDLESRLLAKRQVASRFAAVLEKAYEISEILEVERQMGKVREEIERMEGRLNYLNTSSALSIVKLSIYKEREIAVTKAENPFLENFKKGWNNFVDLLSFFVILWPFLLLLGLFCWYFFRSKKKKKVLS